MKSKQPTAQNDKQNSVSRKKAEKRTLTTREKAAKMSGLTTEQIRAATEGYEERLRHVTTVVMTAEELATLKVAEEYQREEKKSHIVRLTGVVLGKGEFLPPIIVARREGADGQVERYIVDGQQRRRALVEAGLPQLVVEVPFGSVEEERNHFLGIQRGMTVNASHIVAVSETELSAEIVRIARLETHPAYGRIFFGKGRRTNMQLPAKAVENLVHRYGLPSAELASFLTILMKAFEDRPIPVAAVTAAMLRGLVGFYRSHRAFLNASSRGQMAILYGILTAEQKFPRRGDNSKRGGQSCQAVITREFRGATKEKAVA